MAYAFAQCVLRLPLRTAGPAFGLTVWLFGDGLMLPRMGLAPELTAVPRRLLAVMAIAHLACGVVAATLRLLSRYG